MNSLHTYYERMNDEYYISVDRSYNGYICEYGELSCTVMSLNTFETVEETEIDIGKDNAFKVFSDMCRKYGVN